MANLPPLNALRAFEAAARHCNFTRAAQELHVTSAAVGQQVRQLEDWLGRTLFDRIGPRLVLTEAGLRYQRGLESAFRDLASATLQVRRGAASDLVRVTVLPSFAASWLQPRLPRFVRAHPGIELEIDSSAELHDLRDGRFDLALRLGLGRWPGMDATLVARERITPLCAPGLRTKYALRSPRDLLSAPLLYDRPADLWARWFAAAGLQWHEPAGWMMSDSALVLRAAADGLGVAIGRAFLARDLIAEGRLVAPFPLRIPNDYSYWLVHPRGTKIGDSVQVFKQWLLEEASATAVDDVRAGDR